MRKSTRNDETTATARRLAAAMAKLGKPISHTQALTAMAAANGDANRHIAAARVAQANEAPAATTEGAVESETEDRPDSYRFEAAMHDGVAAMLQAFSRHGYRLPELCDEDEVGATLTEAFEPAMERLFTPEGRPEIAGTTIGETITGAARERLKAFGSREGYGIERQVRPDQMGGGLAYHVEVWAWLPHQPTGKANEGGCMITHPKPAKATTLAMGRGRTAAAAEADAVANMENSRFLLRYQRTDCGIEREVRVETFGNATNARRTKNALVGALPARCRMDWQIIRRDDFCAIDAGYADYDDSMPGTPGKPRPTGSGATNPTQTRPQAAAVPEGVAVRALSKLIGSIAHVEAFEDLEGGCDGHGAIVEACEAVGMPLPEKLVAWFKRNDPSYGEPEADDGEDNEARGFTSGKAGTVDARRIVMDALDANGGILVTSDDVEDDADAEDGIVPSPSDQRDFASFCRTASDRQVVGIRDKERDAGRTVYREIAGAEGRRRGLSMD